MKKAPEKIYMTPSYGEPDNVLLASFSKSHLNFHRDIEYTRTDAFIDKACEYLNEICRRFILTEKDIEDFRKHMKGECL